MPTLMKNTSSTGLSQAQVKTIRDAAKKRERLDNDKFEAKTAAAQLVKEEKRAAAQVVKEEKRAAAQVVKEEKRAAALVDKEEKRAAAKAVEDEKRAAAKVDKEEKRAAAQVDKEEKRVAAKAVRTATRLKETNERIELAMARGAELQRQRHVAKQAKEAAEQKEIDDGILKDADYEHQVTYVTARDREFVVESHDLPDLFGLIYEDNEEEERQETARMFDLISAYEAWTLTELESESESEPEPEPEPESNKECSIMNGKRVRKCHCRQEKYERLVKDQPDVDWSNTKWFWSCHCLARQMANVDVSDDEADVVNSSDEEFLDNEDDQPVVGQSNFNPNVFQPTHRQKKFFKRCSAAARKRARVCEPAAAETWTYNSSHGVATAVDNLGFIMLTDVDPKVIEFRIQQATQTSSNGVFQCQNWHAEYFAIKAQWDQFLHPDNPHVAQNTLFYMQDLSHWYQCDTRPHTLNPMRARYALPRAQFACESDAIMSSCPDLASYST
jgi:hypothetical protein